MIGTKRRRSPDDRGVTIVLVALCMTALMAAAAFAVDLGSSRQVTRRLQSTVDAASLAAAQELPLRLDGTDAEHARAVAAEYTARNLHGPTATATPIPSCPPGAGTVAGNTDCYTSGATSIVIESPYAVSGQPLAARHFVFIEVCEDTPTYFSGAIGSGAPRVCRSAVGRRYQAALSYGRGLITIDPHACPGLTIDGSSEVDIVSDGGVFVDSTCDGSVTASGSAWHLSAAAMSTGGGLNISCDPSKCMDGLPPPLTNQPPVGDPLIDLVEPEKPEDDANCIYTGDKEVTCTPGSCSSGSVYKFGTSSTANLVLSPGIHWFPSGVDFGNLNIRVSPGSNEITGEGVLIYTYSGGVNVGGNGTVDFGSGPTIGEYQGISIFSGRSNSSLVKITGNTGLTIGSIYTPNAPLELGGTTSWSVTGMVVAARTKLFGTMDLFIDPIEPASAAPPVEDLGLER